MRSGRHVQLAALRNRDLELQTTSPFNNHGSVESSTAYFRHKNLLVLLGFQKFPFLCHPVFLSVSFRSSSNCSSCISSLIWGPINIPSSIFASLTFGNLFLTHWNPSRVYPYLSQNSSWGPVLCDKVADKNFLRKNKRRTEDIFLPWRQWCSFRSQFMYIVILLVPAVPLTQETAVFCEPELHSELQCHNLEITT